MMHTVILYSKPDCHLCHETRDLLVALRRECAFTFMVVDITTDETLLAQYRHTIPVVVIDDELELTAPILERELRSALR
jgi:glutaredoxin